MDNITRPQHRTPDQELYYVEGSTGGAPFADRGHSHLDNQSEVHVSILDEHGDGVISSWSIYGLVLLGNT